MAYLDSSVMVALLTDDLLTARAMNMLSALPAEVYVSDFAAAEFASVVARKMRTGKLTAMEAAAAFQQFDIWAVDFARVETTTRDVEMAAAFIRRLDVNLLAPDAIHIAICQRLGASLATFDEKMAAAARTLGVALAVA